MYKRYTDIRDTGVNWIPKVPAHWGMDKINALFSERKQTVSDREYPPLSVTKFGVVPQLEGAVKTKNGDNRKLVMAGDFAINSRSDRKGSSGISRTDGSVSLIYIVLEPKETICGAYYHHLLRSYTFVEEFYRNGRGIVADLWTTRYSEMKTIWVPVPPIEEQEQIARFLRWKLSTINQLIPYRALTSGTVIAQSNSLFAREMMLLNEYRIRLISDVVTGVVDIRDVQIPEFDTDNAITEEGDELIIDNEGNIDESEEVEDNADD